MTQAKSIVERAAWTKFTDELPGDGALVDVRSTTGEWPEPRTLRFERNFLGPFAHALLDSKSGRWYWYPERMEWRPIEAKIVAFRTGAVPEGETPNG